MTDHPAKAAGCTKAQIKAFEQICIGIHRPKCTPKTLQALVDKGLVGVDYQILPGRIPVTVKFYYVQIGSSIHMQYGKGVTFK